MPEMLQQEKSKAELTKLVASTEDALRGLSLAPRATETPSQKLASAMEGAESKVRELRPVGDRIDALFGMTGAQLRERLERDVGQVRQKLEAIGGQRVGGEQRYESHVEQLELKLNEVQAALGKKDFDGARKAFGEVQAGIETLSEVIGTARRLVAAGAPAELVGSTDVALEFFRTGKQDRAELLMDAAKLFLDNKELFTTAEGKPGLESLASFSLRVCDETKQMDLAAASGMLGGFRRDLAYPPEIRAADMEELARGAALLGPATAEKVAASVGRLMDDGKVEEARTLAGMALKYIETARSKGADLDTMKSALVRYADSGSQEALEQFGEISARTAFAAGVSRLKGEVGSWSQSAQKNVAQKAIEKTEELVGQRRYEEAGRLLTYTAAYADTVATLGLNRAAPGTQIAPEVVGSMSSMARALGAVERGETTVDGRDIPAIFSDSANTALRAGQSAALLRNYGEVRQKLEGKVPWSKGAEPGRIPLGGDSIGLAELRGFEAKSGDPALAGGATIQQLLASCGTAAKNGDTEAYAKSAEALMKRVSLTVSRYLATRMADGFGQMAEATDAIRKSYGEHVPADVAKRLDSIRADSTALQRGLRDGTAANDPIQGLRYTALADALARERAVAMIGAQAGVNGSYAELAGGITGGMAQVSLRDSSEQLLNARRELLDGNIPAARGYYEAAMSSRQAALALYSAGGRGKEAAGAPALAMFDRWRQAHMDIFDGVLAGKGTSELQERVGLVELSVFTLPENARTILDFSTKQREVRDLALAGNTQGAEAAWKDMQGLLQKQKFWTNAALTVAGVAVGFVPGGQLVSGAIFMSMATTQAMEEKAETGRVSGMTWAMIGVTVATMGMGGAISSLRTIAQEARVAGRLGKAATAAGTANVLTGAALGTGVVMTGLAMPATIEAFREGRYGEGMFNVAMMAFPFAHTAGRGVTGKMAAARAKAVARFETRMKAALYEAAAPKLKIPAIKTRGVKAPVLEGTAEAIEIAGAAKKAAPKGPRAREGMAARVRESRAEGIVSKEEFGAWVAEQGRTGEMILGNKQTGAIIKTLEDGMVAAVKGGAECDVFAVAGDKRALNWINNLFGNRWGDRALDAYFEIIKRSMAACGVKGRYAIRTSGNSDETLMIVVTDKGKGAEVRAALSGNEGIFAKMTKQVMGEYLNPGHPQTIAPLKGMVKDPEKLVAGAFDIGAVRELRAGVPIPEGFLSRLCTTAEEVEGGAASFAPALRKALGIPEASEYIKQERIMDVDARKGETVSGTAFEVRYEVTDKATLQEIAGLLKRTDKGLAESLRNWFGIRGLNTFFGHYGTNSVLTIGERAVAEYAEMNSLSLKRLGTHKYIAENATPRQLRGLYEFVTAQMDQAGIKLKASNRGPVGAKLDEVTGEEALTSISNGHLERRWGTRTYEDANAIISAIGLSNEPMLAKLFGEDYMAVREIVGIVRKNPAIRNVEDLLIALKDPSVAGGLKGRMLTGKFEKYILNRGEDFRMRLQAAAPIATEVAGQAKLAAERTGAAGEPEPVFEARVPAAAPAPKAEVAHSRLYMVDTTYVLAQLKEGRSLYEVFSELSGNGEVVITRQVMAEIEKNLPAFDSRTRRAAINDIYKCMNEAKLSVEDIEVPARYVQSLSRILGRKSEKGNRMVGLGEASALHYAKTVGAGLFNDIRILSADTDVAVLLKGTKLKLGP